MEKKTNLDKMLYIMNRLGQAEILAQLAEEAAELAQAALKYRRALDGANPTPVSAKDACKHLNEEWGDVTLVYLTLANALVALNGDYVPSARLALSDEAQQKLDRWVARLEKAEG